MATVDSIIGNENATGDPAAKNPRSSAMGDGQFIDSTWQDTIAKHRPDIAAALPPDQVLALRSDPVLSREMTAAYAADNNTVLARNGLPVTPGTTYLAHFAGPTGAVGLLNNPNQPAAAVLGPGFAKANPTLAGYTAGQLAAWADRKMGVAGTPTAAPLAMGGPATPVAPAPVAAPTAAPQQYASAPAAPAPNYDMAAPAPFALLPPRPKIDLSHFAPNSPADMVQRANTMLAAQGNRPSQPAPFAYPLP